MDQFRFRIFVATWHPNKLTLQYVSHVQIWHSMVKTDNHGVSWVILRLHGVDDQSTKEMSQ